MRSSKQRQRNKPNRNNRPSGGNIINRVFDSSGPEGKVRGTPQQIIEKYLQLHRDAQLAGDRVNAENFAQHAEHYSRLLAEAMKDVERAREEQEQFHRERQQERERQMEQSREQQQPRERNDREQQSRERNDRDRNDRERDGRDRDRDRGPRFRPFEEQPGTAAAVPVEAEPAFLSQPLFPILVADPQDDAGTGLVETPEERAPRRERDRPRRERRERPEAREESRRDDRAVEAPAETPAAVAPTPVEVAALVPVAEVPATEAPAAEAAPAAEKVRRPRKPRAPRAAVEGPASDAAE